MHTFSVNKSVSKIITLVTEKWSLEVKAFHLGGKQSIQKIVIFAREENSSQKFMGLNPRIFPAKYLVLRDVLIVSYK